MRNALEDAIKSEYASLRRSHPEFCACAQCQSDVLTMALNHTKPRYVSDRPPLGAAVTNVLLAQDSARAELTVIVFEAMRRVAASPRHVLKDDAVHG